MKDSDDFSAWMEKEKGLTKKVAGDNVSRCTRVERVLKITLSKIVVSEKLYGVVIESLKVDVKKFTSSKENLHQVYGPLRRAVRLYAEFSVGKKIEDYPTGFRYR